MKVDSNSVLQINGNEYIPLIEYQDLKDCIPVRIQLYGNFDERIVVVRIGNNVYAFSEFCPHQHKPSLSQGYIEDGCIVCPEHGWKFEIETGEQYDKSVGTHKIKKFEILVLNNQVLLDTKNLLTKKWIF
ncbi:MAG: Rieske (2Fe-2S) protein [Ignavibacteria bacterium]|nr:Rieske (2Fe-2S) protein [Ignavibacteria bacterium]